MPSHAEAESHSERTLSGSQTETYLWILKAEVAHVVVDQAEREAPVHERHAPLRGKRTRLRLIHSWYLYRNPTITDQQA